MTLDGQLLSRDNNLNLIRALAASAVLVSHAYPIALGKGAAQPLQQPLGYSLGHLAVLVFFAISGFLITASFDRRATLSQFVTARIARLVPGLAVSVILVALVLGPLTTTLSTSDYFSDPATLTFIIRNILTYPVQYGLPGVFLDNPYTTVEGSIWTLFFEILCYAGVVLAGLTGLLASRRVATAALVAWCLLGLVLAQTGIRTVYQLDQLLMLSQPFALGMLAYLWRDRLIVGWMPLAALAAVTTLLRDTPVYSALLIVTLSYGTLVLAILPGGPIRAFNRLGDYSYGIYVYAFPLQGLMVWAFGTQTPVQNILLAMPATLFCAVLSWHFVEAPALAWVRQRRVISGSRAVTASGGIQPARSDRNAQIRHPKSGSPSPSRPKRATG